MIVIIDEVEGIPNVGDPMNSRHHNQINCEQHVDNLDFLQIKGQVSDRKFPQTISKEVVEHSTHRKHYKGHNEIEDRSSTPRNAKTILKVKIKDYFPHKVRITRCLTYS